MSDNTRTLLVRMASWMGGIVAGIVLLLLLMLGIAAPRAAWSDAPRYGRTDLNGKTYLRLADWAKANHFDIHWLRTGDSVQLSRPGGSMLVRARGMLAAVRRSTGGARDGGRRGRPGLGAAAQGADHSPAG